MYERPEKVHHDAEGVSEDKNQHGKEYADVGGPGNEVREQVDDHADRGRAEPKRQQTAVAQDVPKEAGDVVEAEHAGK